MRAERRVDLGLAAAVAAPALVAVVAAVAHGWAPVGDQAGELARIADVGTARTPLVGPYSRGGWSHPGPLLFWVCAPGWRLRGTAGVMATVGLVHAGSAAAAVVLARRLAGTALAAPLAAALLLVQRAMGPSGLVDLWNPYVGTLALVAGLVAVAAAASAVDRALPVAVLALSWAVQAHVGPVPTAGAAVLAGAALVVAARRVPDRRWLAGAVILAALAWSGPLVDQATHDPGNLRALAAGLGDPAAPRPDTATALGHAADHLGVVPAWVRGGGDLTRRRPAWTLGVLPAALALAGRAAHRRGDRGLQAASVVAGAAVVAAVAAATRVDLVVASYLYRWTWAVGAVGWAVVVAGPARWLTRGLGPRAGVAVVVAGAVAVSAAGLADGERRVPTPVPSAAAADLLDQLADLPRAGRYLVVVHGDDWGTVATGVGVGLAVAGHDVAFPASFRPQMGDHRVVEGTDGRQLLVVLVTPTFAARPPRPGARRIAVHDPLSTAERVRVGDLIRRIRRQVGAPPGQPIDAQGYGGAVLVAQGADPADVDALAALAARGRRSTVWLAG
ncbi:MAG TPA: hypothetical protein VFU19_00170 [Iamia sp.]|nr:hypothetical protein [Iamia sp.]